MPPVRVIRKQLIKTAEMAAQKARETFMLRPFEHLSLSCCLEYNCASKWRIPSRTDQHMVQTRMVKFEPSTTEREGEGEGGGPCFAKSNVELQLFAVVFPLRRLPRWGLGFF